MQVNQQIATGMMVSLGWNACVKWHSTRLAMKLNMLAEFVDDDKVLEDPVQNQLLRACLAANAANETIEVVETDVPLPEITKIAPKAAETVPTEEIPAMAITAGNTTVATPTVEETHTTTTPIPVLDDELKPVEVAKEIPVKEVKPRKPKSNAGRPTGTGIASNAKKAKEKKAKAPKPETIYHAAGRILAKYKLQIIDAAKAEFLAACPNVAPSMARYYLIKARHAIEAFTAK